MKKYILIFFLFFIQLNAVESLYESQPNIIFKYNEIKEKVNNYNSIIIFNKSILLIEEKKYELAIKELKGIINNKELDLQIKVNLGIAYYKLNNKNQSLIYLNSLINKKVLKKNPYIYLIASYYKSLIKKDDLILINSLYKYENLENKLDKENINYLASNLYIYLKQYKKAFKYEQKIKANPIRKIVLLLRLDKYEDALIELNKYKNNEFLIKKEKDILIWLNIYIQIKRKNNVLLKDAIFELDERIMNSEEFDINKRFPLNIKLKNIFKSNFKLSRKDHINILFYYIPYIFNKTKTTNSEEYIFKGKKKLIELNKELNYNKNLLKNINKDPLIKIEEMNKIKIDKAYQYFNKGLMYLHVYDYRKAYINIKKASFFDRDNSLYSLIALLNLELLNIKENPKIITRYKNTILRKRVKETYNSLLSFYLYDIYLKKDILNTSSFQKIKEKRLKEFDNRFPKNKINNFKFLKSLKEKGIYKANIKYIKTQKEPFGFLLKNIQENKGELYNLFFRNSIHFMNQPFIVSDLYFRYVANKRELSKIKFNFNKTDLLINSPSFYKNIILYNILETPEKSIKLLDELFDKYNIESEYFHWLFYYSYLKIENNFKDKNNNKVVIYNNELIKLHKKLKHQEILKKYNKEYNKKSNDDELNSKITLSLLNFIYKSNNASYLSGLYLLNELKLKGILVYLLKNFEDDKLEIGIDNLDLLFEEF